MKLRGNFCQDGIDIRRKTGRRADQSTGVRSIIATPLRAAFVRVSTTVNGPLPWCVARLHRPRLCKSQGISEIALIVGPELRYRLRRRWNVFHEVLAPVVSGNLGHGEFPEPLGFPVFAKLVQAATI